MSRLSAIAGRAPALLIVCLMLIAAPLNSMAAEPAIDENFNGLEGWQPFNFPKIKSHSDYAVGMINGLNILIANSSASASAIIHEQVIDVYETPMLRWRWRTENVYKNGDITSKKGDDAPIRVYVMFQYDAALASAGMRFKYGLAKAIYGHYPPHASLNYVWASKVPEGDSLKSAYTDRSAMMVHESGIANIGRWTVEEANMLDDYRRAFGQEPPRKARLAVMNDSDNTGEAARSYIDYIRVESK